MNQDQVMSFLRNVLMFAGGFVVSKGWIDNTTMIELVGAVATIGALVWSLWTHAGATKSDLVAVAAGTATVKQEAVVAKTVEKVNG